MSELKLYFSLVSGDLYYIGEDEVKNLDKSQVPLLKKPRSNCKKCYGRFYIGKDIIKNYYVPCPKCSRSCVDWDAMKEGEVVVETPKTTNEVADHDFIMEEEKVLGNI